MLPLKRCFSFWYPEALITLIRSWKNLLQVLEEDLAVSQMFKLLFVPLFHDSSIFGRFLSFLFRMSRVLIGFLGYIFISVAFLIISITWFLTPLLMLASLVAQFIAEQKVYFIPGLDFLKGLSSLYPILILGFALFLHNHLYTPHKKVWQIKSLNEIWLTTKLKKKDLRWKNLLASDEIFRFLESLELKIEDLAYINPKYIETEFLRSVYALAKFTQARFITGAYFLVGLLKTDPKLDSELKRFNLNFKDIKQALLFLEHKRHSWRKVYFWDEDFAARHLKGVNRNWLGVPTPALDSISTDLTREAARKVFPDFIGRGSVVKEVIDVLSSNKRNCLITGKAGSGKSSLIKYLAKIINLGVAPNPIIKKRIVNLDMAKLLNGVSSKWELSEKLKRGFSEAENAQNIIIYISEIHELLHLEKETELNLNTLLRPYFKSEKLQFLATIDSKNYTLFFEKDPDFEGVFERIDLKEATQDEIYQILFEKAIELAKNRGKVLTLKALKEIVEKSAGSSEKAILGEAVEVLEDAASQGGAYSNLITYELIAQIFIEMHAKDSESLDGKLSEKIDYENLSEEGLAQVIRMKLEQLSSKFQEQGYLIEFNSQLTAEIIDNSSEKESVEKNIDSLDQKVTKLISEGKLEKGEPIKMGIEILS